MSKYSQVSADGLSNAVFSALRGLDNDNLDNIYTSLSNKSVFNCKASSKVIESINSIRASNITGSKRRLEGLLSTLSKAADKISILQSREREVATLVPAKWVYEDVLKGYEKDENDEYKTNERGWLIPIYEKENVYHENDQVRINSLKEEITSLEAEIDALLS